MPRAIKKKTGKIQTGFPKLAFFTGTSKRLSLPHSISNWDRNSYSINSGELVVIVAIGSRYTYLPMKKILVYHYVPYRALEEKLVPLTAIYNWTVNYVNLPWEITTNFQLIEKEIDGKITTTIAA